MQTTALPEGWFTAGSHPSDYEAGGGAIDGKAAAYLRARVAFKWGLFATLLDRNQEIVQPRAHPRASYLKSWSMIP